MYARRHARRHAHKNTQMSNDLLLSRQRKWCVTDKELVEEDAKGPEIHRPGRRATAVGTLSLLLYVPFSLCRAYLSCPTPRTISGAMYSGLPQKVKVRHASVPLPAPLLPPLGSTSKTFANPQSIILRYPLRAINRFSGFKSLCFTHSIDLCYHKGTNPIKFSH